METLQILSRSEMKNIMAGIEGCVSCCTPGGCESWYRDDISSDGSNIGAICNSIYPAHHDDIVANMTIGECDHN